MAADDGLTLIAQDMEVGIRYELRGVQVAKAGEAILAISHLTSILRESQDADVTIDANDDGAKVKIGTSRFEMPGYPVDEFPDLPTFDDGGRYHEITAGDLRRMIRRTSFAADKKDSTRFALSGVLWEAEGKVARLVATDSKRLAVCEGPATLYGQRTRPRFAPGARHDHEPARPQPHGRRRTHPRGPAAERSAVPDRKRHDLFAARGGPLPAVPRHHRPDEKAGESGRSRLPVESFLSRVRQAAIMTDDESKRVDLTFAPGKITMKARGAETGSSEVVMMLPEYDGGPVTIAFDPQYVVEFLRAIDGEPTVLLELSDGSKPALFQCGDTYQYLVMPLAG